jgi:hypothetical protein
LSSLLEPEILCAVYFDLFLDSEINHCNTMADSALAQLNATALTARCHNAFFRQKQLKSLHDGIATHSKTP